MSRPTDVPGLPTDRPHLAPDRPYLVAERSRLAAERPRLFVIRAFAERGPIERRPAEQGPIERRPAEQGPIEQGSAERAGDPGHAAAPEPVLSVWGHSFADRAVVSWRPPHVTGRQLLTFTTTQAAQAAVDRAYPHLKTELTWYPEGVAPGDPANVRPPGADA